MRYWINLFVAAIVVGLMAAGAKAYLPQQPLVTVDQNFLPPNVFPNPTSPFPLATWEAYNGVTTKTQIAPPLPSGRNVFLIIAGEGNSAGISPTQYTPVNSANIFNVNIFDGGVYAAVDPLLGHTPWGRDSGVVVTPIGTSGPGYDNGACSPNCSANGSWATRLADLLITDGTFDNVFLVPTAVYNSPITAFYGPYTDVGGPTGCTTGQATGVGSNCLWQRISVACSRIIQLGGFNPHISQPPGTPLTGATAVLFGQGEGDSHNPNIASYWGGALSNTWIFASLQCGLNAGGDGQWTPWFVAQETYTAAGGIDATLATMQSTGTVDFNNFFPAPNIDSIGPQYRTGPAGGTYLDDNGMAIAAQLWRSSLYSSGLFCGNC